MATSSQDDDLEWEEWDPSKLSYGHHMVAGSIAGLAEHVSMFPVDSVKTHIQCERCGTPLETWSSAFKIVQREGVFRLYRGVSAMFAGCIPAHAAYFSIYEGMKKSLVESQGNNPATAAVCGASASFVHDMILTPFDTIKQRMQLGYYKSFSHCIRTILSQEGIRAFYVSLPLTLMMNLPYGSIMVSTNDTLRNYLNPTGEFNPQISMFSGGIAGAIAAALTNPLDVIKTRLQTRSLDPVNLNLACPQEVRSLIDSVTSAKTTTYSSSASSTTSISSSSSSSPSSLSSPSSHSILDDAVCKVDQKSKIVINKVPSSPSSTSSSSSISSQHQHQQTHRRPNQNFLSETWLLTRQLYRQEGWRVFVRGIVPRMFVNAPSVAVSWTCYEFVKDLLVVVEGKGKK